MMASYAATRSIRRCLQRPTIFSMHSVIPMQYLNIKKNSLRYDTYRGIQSTLRDNNPTPQEEYIEPASYAMSIIYRTIKYIVVGFAIIGGGGYTIWRGGHLYLEQFVVNTPSELPRRARDCLRCAYVSENIYRDDELVDIYLVQARGDALKVLDKSNDVILDIERRLGDAADRKGDLSEALEYYLGVWKRVNDPEFNLYVSSRLANIYIRLARYDDAKQCLEWNIQTIANDLKNSYLVPTLTGLADLEALKRNYKKALSLYYSALHHLQEQKAEEIHHKNKYIHSPTSPCEESIISEHLGQVFYGLGKHNEAMGWFQKAYMNARDVLGPYADVDMNSLLKEKESEYVVIAKRPEYEQNPALKDCDDCIALSLADMAIALEKTNEFSNLEKARDYLSVAIGHSMRAQDPKSEKKYQTHLDRVIKQIENLQNTTLSKSTRRNWFNWF